MGIAHAASDGEFPGLSLRHDRQLRREAPFGGKLRLECLFPPRLFLRKQHVRGHADDGGQENVISTPACLLLACQPEHLLVGRRPFFGSKLEAEPFLIGVPTRRVVPQAMHAAEGVPDGDKASELRPANQAVTCPRIVSEFFERDDPGADGVQVDVINFSRGRGPGRAVGTSEARLKDMTERTTEDLVLVGKG